MFIGHYKAVNSSGEFYSEFRSTIDFPTQVVFNGERFLLYKTIQVTSKKQQERIIASAKNLNISYNVEID